MVDADGVTWRVWDVRPALIDRRYHIRRIQVIKIRHRERRLTATRRIDMMRSRLYFPPTEEGWLCFESDRERVRLKPIPGEWPVLGDEELDTLRRAAARDGECEEACADPPPGR